MWESLLGREHLLFYRKLKNLKGSALTQVSVFEIMTRKMLHHSGSKEKNRSVTTLLPI